MEQLDLTEILKDCPKGTKLYSPLLGEVEFDCICSDSNYPIKVRVGGLEAVFSIEGKYYISYPNGECMLFPSKEQRDWSKFKAPREDLPIDTPVMVKDAVRWSFRYYSGNGTAYFNGSKSVDSVSCSQWKYIIPFDKFNPNDIEGSIKNFNYGTNKD